jgi:glycine/D-amino acid oxidase-like deaminating enzyme
VASTSVGPTPSPWPAACAARQWNLPHEVLDAAEIRAGFPTFNPQMDEVGLFEAKAGFVRPEATVAAHLRLAQRHGADLPIRPAVAVGSSDGCRRAGLDP